MIARLRQLYRFLHPSFQNLFLDYKVDFKPRYGHGKAPHQGLYQIINANRKSYQSFLKEALTHQEHLCKILDHKAETNRQNPTWNNGFLPGLDILGIYTMLAHFKPKKYIEIGSGNSTKVAYKAKIEQHLESKIISIDPQPRAEIDALADTIIRKRFEDSDYDLIAALEANDILFVDNSHRILPNSDAMVFFMEILPRLKKGVIVHIHDIYLPYDYPPFMCKRAYSEQYGLAMYLLANPSKYQPIFPCYFISEDQELRQILAPFWQQPNLQDVEQHGGSFWLRIGE